MREFAGQDIGVKKENGVARVICITTIWTGLQGALGKQAGEGKSSSYMVHIEAVAV